MELKGKMTDKELMMFSKKELIQVIFSSGWIFNPIEILYRNRVKANHDMVGKILEENSNLGKQIHNGISPSLFLKIHEALEKNHKKIDRLYAENEKIEKMLYGDAVKEGDSIE